MKRIVKKGRRVCSVVLAVLMLAPGVMQSLKLSALAADTSSDFYSFIAANCYSDQQLAVSILASGALVDAGTVTISYPGSELLSVSGVNLNAQTHPSGLNDAEWVPVTYTIEGDEKPFVDGVGALTQQGEFHVDALYQLNTGISSDMLNLPAILAQEAASQITVLNHLTSPDQSYMTYMEQMTYDNMDFLYTALDPAAPPVLADQVVLSDDAEKNLALKNSFRAVIDEMMNDCYLEDGTLTLFDLLDTYRNEKADGDGLLEYYKNYAKYGEEPTYKEELAKFNKYMQALFAAEPENGLTADDKKDAIERMLVLADEYEVFEEGTTINFAELRDTVAVADAKLIAPNAAINLSLSKRKLRPLVDILDETAVAEGDTVDENGMIPWTSVVAPYGDALTLTQTVGADLEVEAVSHNYESVVTDPTCTEPGYTTHTCSICGDSYQDTPVEATGHDYESVVTDPTCTEPGYTTHTCSVCGDNYQDTPVEATGHSFGTWYVETAPAYGEKGTERRDCQNDCDHYETRDAIVARVGESEYVSLDAALAAAALVGGTVDLLIDATVEGAVIPTGVTLNLGSAALTADYVVGLNGSYLTANTNSGKLIVEQGNLVLPEEGYWNGAGNEHQAQYVLPIWDPENNCYLFSRFVVNTATDARGLKIDEANEKIYFQFRHLATSALNTRLLADGAGDNALKVVVRLEWKNKFGEAYQDFVYNDEFVGAVTGGYDYSFTMTGYSTLGIDIDTLTVTAMIITDSGAAASGAVWNIGNAK